jgi:uncharacterized protein YndB with AHSA1/START domain
MSVETTDSLRLTRTIRADRQAVWDAWTQPEHIMKWGCPVPDGMAKSEVDLRVGGAFVLMMRIEGNTHTAVGTYREVDEPSRLVYTWDWKEEGMRMGDTLVSVEFNEVDGGTEIVLLHEGFPAPEAKAGHMEGWTACLAHVEGLFA